MIENTKCTCGHNNPVGTLLCENCGRPLDKDAEGIKQGELNMRYEGAARRSQTYKKTLIDRIWNFFSSVKVAVILILITLVASIVGTIFPQERYVPAANKEAWYEQQYGVWGEIYYKLGLGDMYGSWWYVTLLALIGISLVICSLDRVVPLYKALKNQRVKKDVAFIDKQRVAASRHISDGEEEIVLRRLTEKLSEKRYNVRRDGNALLAEKGRISRWGPYINHIGLIIFLLGTLMRLIPGWYLDEYVWVREGETADLPGTDYALKNEQAIIKFYDPEEAPESQNLEGQIVEQYETHVVLYKKDEQDGGLEEIKSDVILVNHPLKHEDLLVYQSGFQQSQPVSLRLTLNDNASGKTVGTFDVNLDDPQPTYTFDNGIRVEIMEYYPDFALEDNKPTTRSNNPNRPAFVFNVVTPEKPEGEKSWVISGLNLDELSENNRYDIALADIEMVNVSGLMVRMDKSLPIIFTGAGIFMVGVVIGFYWQHRRVWVGIQDRTLHFGAHTNKNWFGLKKELRDVADAVGLDIPDKPST